MKKDVDSWNIRKKDIHDIGESKLYHARETWWCNLGINIGSEQDGDKVNYDRPVLILRGLSRQTCIILPLTTSKERHKMRMPIGKIQDQDASVIISQIRVIDTKRLVKKIEFLDKKIFKMVTKAVKSLF